VSSRRVFCVVSVVSLWLDSVFTSRCRWFSWLCSSPVVRVGPCFLRYGVWYTAHLITASIIPLSVVGRPCSTSGMAYYSPAGTWCVHVLCEWRGKASTPKCITLLTTTTTRSRWPTLRWNRSTTGSCDQRRYPNMISPSNQLGREAGKFLPAARLTCCFPMCRERNGTESSELQNASVDEFDGVSDVLAILV